MKNSGQLSESKRQLLERVLRGEMGRETWEAPLLRHAPGTTVPLAPSQQQVWLHSQMGDTRFVYNEPITIHYHGVLDQHLLELSFQEFLRRHEIWRTTFAIVDNQVVQLVQPKLELEIPLTDLTALPDEDREAEATRIATLDAQRPFDLAVGPLLRGRLFKLRDDKFRFHITLHHIIFDGVSIYRTVLPELAAIYNAFAKGEPSPLPEPELQYGDFALWQERLQQTPSVREQVTYWKEQLAGELPILELPTDHARPQLPSYRGGMEKFAISAELSSAVKRRSKTEGVTHYMFLLAAFKAMLHRYSGQEDILVGGATDGRRRREFHNLIGYFLNTLVLRTKPKGSLSFRDYLAQVKRRGHRRARQQRRAFRSSGSRTSVEARFEPPSDLSGALLHRTARDAGRHAVGTHADGYRDGRIESRSVSGNRRARRSPDRALHLQHRHLREIHRSANGGALAVVAGSRGRRSRNAAARSSHADRRGRAMARRRFERAAFRGSADHDSWAYRSTSRAYSFGRGR